MQWTHRVEAYNTATESANRMHDDSVARTYGFSGGLVPGVDVWAYATRPCVDRWGEEFLHDGTMEMRFVAPVYDGESVTATLAEDGELTVVGADGTVRATGRGGLGAAAVAPRTLPRAPLPNPAPTAEADLLRPGTALGTLEFHYRAGPAASYLRDVRDEHPVHAGGARSHPGFLARQANYVLASSVRLGPWIHVSTVARHRDVIRDGETVEVRGRVEDEREHKGHRFVDLAVEISAAGRSVWSAEHTAIWRPRVASR